MASRKHDVEVLDLRFAMIGVVANRVNGLMQGAAERDVKLLKSPADREDRQLAIDRGADQRQSHRVPVAIDGLGDDRLFVAVMHWLDVEMAPVSKMPEATSRTEPMSVRPGPTGTSSGWHSAPSATATEILARPRPRRAR